MGSWNETCGLSGLPIEHNDKVKAIFLQYNGAGAPAEGESLGLSYPNEKWAVFSPPISGTYDDYGAVEKFDMTPTASLLLRIVQKNWKDEKIASLKDFSERCWRGDISIPHHLTPGHERKVRRGVGFMLIHEEIWTNTLSMCDAQGAFEKCKKFITASPFERADNRTETFMTQSFNMINMYQSEIGASDDFIKKASELFCIESMMNKLRIAYSPQVCGAGSSATCWDERKKFNKLVNKFIKKKVWQERIASL